MFEPISQIMSAVVMAFTAPLLAALPATDQMPMQPPTEMMQPGPTMEQSFQRAPIMQPPQEGAMVGQPPSQQFGGEQFNRMEQPPMRPQIGPTDGKFIFRPGDNNINFGGEPHPQGEPRGQGGGFFGRSDQDGQNRGPNMMGGSYGGERYGGQEGGKEMMNRGFDQTQGDGEEEMTRQQAEMEKRQEEMERREEERQKQMEAQQLKMMQRGMKGMLQGVNFVKSSLDKAKKQGIAVSAEDEAIVNEIIAAVDVIKNATSLTEEVQNAMDVIQEKGEDLREIGPRIEMLRQWPKILNNANRQIASLRKSFDKAKLKISKSKNKIDISEISVQIEASIVEVEKARDELKNEVAKGETDMEDLMESMRDEVFEPMDDIRVDIGIMQNLSNINSELKKVDTMIKNFEARSARLKKLKKDVTEINRIIAAMKAKRDEVKQLIATPKFDMDDLFTLFSDGEGLLNEIQQEFARLENKKTDLDNQFDFSSGNVDFDFGGFQGPPQN